MMPANGRSNLLSSPTPLPGELTTDYRARIAIMQQDAAERRQRELAEQISELKTPAERIRIWEELHMLRLPSEPSHPLLNVIARNTALTMGQLHDEQKARQASATAKKSA